MFGSALAKYIGSPDRLAVERAVAELRAGRFVVLEEEGEGPLLVAAAENADAALLRAMAAGGKTVALVLPQERLRHLGIEAARAMALPAGTDPALLQDLLFAEKATPRATARKAGAAELRALELMLFTFLLPAVLAVPLERAEDAGLSVRVSGRAVAAFPDRAAQELREKARASDPMIGSEDVEVVIFEGGCGLRDQIALVIGSPDPRRPVLVRMHSACLLGDLMGSLRCDCGQQLRDAVAEIAAVGGGILLYLDQEGRGIGLRNKIRAYRLQSAGYDTVEADSLLGYGPDQRRYEVAARMLDLLGYRSVILMSNNREKREALEAFGVAVREHAPVQE